jgi:lipopolysaccharide biosynthesis regulator YciM
MTIKNPDRAGESTSVSNSLYISGLDAVIEKQFDHAVQLLSKAVSLNSDIPNAYYHLGKLYLEKGDIIRGQKIFRDLLLRSDLDDNFRQKVENALIAAYISRKDFTQAQKLLLHRIKKYPDNSEAHLALAKILERKNNFEKALKHWLVYAKLNKIESKPRLALYKVEIARSQTNPQSTASVNLLKQALKMDPKCAPAYILLAKHFHSMGKTTKVLENWGLLIKEAPEKSPWIYSDMEKYLYELNRYNELLDIYKSLVRKKGPHETTAKLALAKQYFKRGEKKLAYEVLMSMRDQDIVKKITLKELIQLMLMADQEEKNVLKIQELFNSLLSLKSFVCKKCGRKSKEAEWHCPECGAWDSYLY